MLGLHVVPLKRYGGSKGDEKWPSCKKVRTFQKAPRRGEDASSCRFGGSNYKAVVSVGAIDMDSSAERDYAVERSNGEGGSSLSRDVLTGKSPWSTAALQDQGRATTVDSPGDVSIAERQRDDRLPLDTAAWKLGHDLIDRHEYERAAECFRRMVLLAEASGDRLSVQEVEVAVELCAALSREQSVEKKLRDVRKVLGRDLSRLGHEE